MSSFLSFHSQKSKEKYDIPKRDVYLANYIILMKKVGKIHYIKFSLTVYILTHTYTCARSVYDVSYININLSYLENATKSRYF